MGAAGRHVREVVSRCPHPESNIRDSIVKEKKAARNLKAELKRANIINTIVPKL
ncbi:MAG: hypothetical protein PUP93_31815 [Rhizonema sp. NSF051]|nr:hypothetical protein [Rhizonema sp. NSF051]